MGQSFSTDSSTTDGTTGQTPRERRVAMTTAAVSAIAELLGTPAAAIPTGAPFTDLGLSSTQLARLAGVLEDALGVPVSLTALYDHPDIDQLIEHLATL